MVSIGLGKTDEEWSACHASSLIATIKMPINYQDQLQPGTFEHAVHDLIEQNDRTGSGYGVRKRCRASGSYIGWCIIEKLANDGHLARHDRPRAGYVAL